MTNAIDKAANEFKVINKPFRIKSENGFIIEGMANLESTWGWFVAPESPSQAARGMLYKKADIVIVNPDRMSPISSFNLQIDEQIHCRAGRQELERSDISIIACPRDAAVVAPIGEENKFIKELKKTLPSAPLRVRAFSGDHDFVEQHTGQRPNHSNGGISLMDIRQREIGVSISKILSELEASDAVSADAGIRKAIVDYFKSAIQHRQQIEETKTDEISGGGGGNTHPRINYAPSAGLGL